MELHGDWRTATRLYGSPLRRALSPLADAVGAFGLRRADAVRTVSTYTSGLVRELGVEPAREFAAFMDLELFLERPPEPLPERPAALFVGVLELYKNVDGLAARVAPRRAARARTRSCASSAAARSARSSSSSSASSRSRRRWTERLTQAEVAAALDEATCLVLPSRSEGLGRVLIEAFLRGRPAVAMGIGGITDVVEDGVSGLLVQTRRGARRRARPRPHRPRARRAPRRRRPRGGRALDHDAGRVRRRLAELVAATTGAAS